MKNSHDQDIENKIFEFAKNDKSVPLYVDQAINNAINRKKNSTSFISKLKKIIILALSLGVATTSIVFAKNIVNFFKNIFNNSTPGIESAVKNSYVQNVDTDFIYDNNIGIKVDNLIIDNNILDISLIFNLSNLKDINNVTVNEFNLINENNKIIELYNDEYENKSVDDNNLYFIEMKNDSYKVNNLYYDSILIRTNDKFNFRFLKMKISKLKISFKNGSFKTIDGNWNFELNIDDRMLSMENMSYDMDYDNSILDVSNNINETNFIVDIRFLNKFDEFIISDYNNIKLINENTNVEYKISELKIENNNIHIVFDYGKYILKDNLKLHIMYDVDECIDIDLKKR